MFYFYVLKLRGVGSLVEIRTSGLSLVLREDRSRGVGSPIGAEPLSGVYVLLSVQSCKEPNSGDVMKC